VKVPGPLIEAELVKRLSRFSLEAKVQGRRVKAYIPNPARLPELFSRTSRLLLLRPPHKEGRKTAYEVFGARLGDQLIGLDARVPNALFAEGIERGLLPEFKGYSIVRRDPAYRGSKLDFLLERGSERALVEVKNCSLVIDGEALFPDAPTERGVRQLGALARALSEGYRAYIVWFIQRADARSLRPYWEVDEQFARALAAAAKAGVALLAYRAELRGDEVAITGEVPVRLHEEYTLVRGASFFLRSRWGLDGGLADAIARLYYEGSLPRSSGQAAKLQELGLAIASGEGLIPLHPRMAVTNLVKALKLDALRADVDRAVTLLTGLQRLREER
jgi:sugar fermentation stimulation protein A